MTARVFIACTGGAAGAQAELWKTPGCSAYFAGAAFPYARDQLEELLGFAPERACSVDTALELAMAAYQRAWLPGCSEAIGLGLTAVLASSLEHRGKHRIHAALMSSKGVWARSVVLEKGSGAEARKRDGLRADAIVHDLLACAQQRESWQAIGAEHSGGRARELFFRRPVFTVAGTRVPIEQLAAGALFPGAFNPPHAGHLGAAAACGSPVVFTITANAPHKPALTLPDLLQRAKLLRGQCCAFTEGDALYIEKARRFPGRSVVIGADALARLLDERWGVPIRPMLDEFAQLGTRFLVFGRTVDGTFMTTEAVLDAAGVPAEQRGIFEQIAGHWDTSSSDLRRTS